MNQARKCKKNSFYKTIPHTRNLVSLSIIDDIILKYHGNEIENFIEENHDLRENILCMLAFEKLINDEQETIRPILKDDDHQQKSYLLTYKWL